ncbi:MAG TPA: hypothetical protein VHZ32_20015 [Rhizomicrobium sp.]|jgi:hypothetical protein|nr:hypothetical protein [Rhizomicrobium sp.]
MFLLEVLGGWFVLSCVAAPFIGRFIALNATIAEEAPSAAGELQQAY